MQMVGKTRVWQVDPLRPEQEVIEEAALVLQRGGLVAFPTETVYGLGALVSQPEAVRSIFAAKGRPQDNPLIVHIAERAELEKVAGRVDLQAFQLVKDFWPGPLTLVLPRNPKVPGEVSAGLPTVAVRMPAHPVPLALIKAAGQPIAAPSANISGRPSPTRAEHVLADLGGKIDGLIDGGEAGIGLESTVVDLTVKPPVILRPGAVTLEELQRALGEVIVDPRVLETGMVGEQPRSPGMKYAHYAPRTPLVVVEGEPMERSRTIQRLIDKAKKEKKRVGLLASLETALRCEADEVVAPGVRQDVGALAAGLYAALRSLDESGVEIIIAEGVSPEGLGLAVTNRLRRAAGGNIIRAG